MADAFAFLGTSDIPPTLDTLLKCEETLRALRNVETGVLEGKIHDIIIGMLKEVNETAARMAGIADGAIVKHILQTQGKNRPFFGQMETHIVSEPGPLGNVKIALLAELEKIVNPQGFGTFWRAQEFGTGKDGVPAQIGRPLVGTFQPSGTGPASEQRGLGKGTDALFQPGRSASGGRGNSDDSDAVGAGRISVELPGRHFLRDGSLEAVKLYMEAMKAVSDRWAKATNDLVAEIPGALRGMSTHTFILRA